MHGVVAAMGPRIIGYFKGLCFSLDVVIPLLVFQGVQRLRWVGIGWVETGVVATLSTCCLHGCSNVAYVVWAPKCNRKARFGLGAAPSQLSSMAFYVVFFV